MSIFKIQPLCFYVLSKLLYKIAVNTPECPLCSSSLLDTKNSSILVHVSVQNPAILCSCLAQTLFQKFYLNRPCPRRRSVPETKTWMIKCNVWPQNRANIIVMSDPKCPSQSTMFSPLLLFPRD